MSKWHDIASLQPPGETLLSFRRYPEATPAVFGEFFSSAGQARVGPAAWPLPWLAITHWTDNLLGPPDWPAPPLPAAPWRDIFWHPPADGQFGWIRRFDSDCAVIRAQWSEPSRGFLIPSLAWSIPWWAVWKWRPA